jgi:tRNA threonylcarbamoyladenosine modification (KEOPS) complex  Pcc1 subunit
MGEVVQFIPKAERERIRLIREARAIYDSVFPSTNSVNEQRDSTPIARSVNAVPGSP